MQNSYMATCGEQGMRLDAYVIKCMPSLSRSYVKKLIEAGNITINGKAVKSGEKIKEGYTIVIDVPEPQTLDILPEDIAIDIVYQDDDLAVINKQKGLIVHPANNVVSGTLVNALMYHIKNLSAINGVVRPGIVHRLDKDTTGLIIIAKNDVSHVNLAKQIENKTCHRYYVAICKGVFKQDEGVIKTGYGRSLKDRKKMAVFPLGQGKVAETHYKVLQRFNGYTFVEFKLQTGRTHQIRVHCRHINHPIVGDLTYGTSDSNFKTDGQLLHAYKIEFTQPTTNEPKTIQVPYSKDIIQALDKLNKTKRV